VNHIYAWHDGLHDELKWKRDMMLSINSAASWPSDYRMCVMLYLHSNHLISIIDSRLLCFTSNSSGSSSCNDNDGPAQDKIDVAVETIGLLSYISYNAGMRYSESRLLFNTMLVEALTVLLLCAMQDPASFASSVRDGVHGALDLVRSQHRDDSLDNRLAKMMRRLESVAPKPDSHKARKKQREGNPEHSTDDQSRVAALAMAGLAGHSIDETALSGRSRGSHGRWRASADAVPSSREEMVNELMSLYEAACAKAGQDPENPLLGDLEATNGTAGPSVAAASEAEGLASGVDGLNHIGEGELGRILRDA